MIIFCMSVRDLNSEPYICSINVLTHWAIFQALNTHSTWKCISSRITRRQETGDRVLSVGGLDLFPGACLHILEKYSLPNSKEQDGRCGFSLCKSANMHLVHPGEWIDEPLRDFKLQDNREERMPSGVIYTRHLCRIEFWDTLMFTLFLAIPLFNYEQTFNSE